jgi:general secretion pathway protein G
MDRKLDRRRQQGFTLLELLVVIVILGMLVAIASPQALKFLGSAKVDTARIQISNLSTVLDLYRLQTGSYPSSSEGLGALVERPASAKNWNGPYVKKADALIDPWGNPYQYRSPGQRSEFDLFSLGSDRREGGEGDASDIGNW